MVAAILDSVCKLKIIICVRMIQETSQPSLLSNDFVVSEKKTFATFDP